MFHPVLSAASQRTGLTQLPFTNLVQHLTSHSDSCKEQAQGPSWTNKNTSLNWLDLNWRPCQFSFRHIELQAQDIKSSTGSQGLWETSRQKEHIPVAQFAGSSSGSFQSCSTSCSSFFDSGNYPWRLPANPPFSLS